MIDLRLGSNLDVLPTLLDNSIDSCVTDPPYELGFMGKKWDATGIAYSSELWAQILRVLKPGGHVLAFSGTRTYHRMACAIEDAGFEIRDQMQWLYGSGFPKSHDISKAIDKEAGAERETIQYPPRGEAYGSMVGCEVVSPWIVRSREVGYHEVAGPVPITEEAERWQGWGTALKPANEPICLARKPFEGTVADNVLAWGTGALNIDGCRIPTNGEVVKPVMADSMRNGKVHEHPGWDRPWKQDTEEYARRIEARAERANRMGRWPANILFDEETAAWLDEQSGLSKSGAPRLVPEGTVKFNGRDFNSGKVYKEKERVAPGYSDFGGASRFFYVAKASTQEREAGLDDLALVPAGGMQGRHDGSLAGGIVQRRNHHPTVKPVALMAYLCRLITPPGGTVLDPFMGSGSTGIAAISEGFGFTGIELSPEYYDIARPRIDYALSRLESAA